ncbi:MAG TPA: endo-1,4-beta-xylanase [Baekduia sp.]|nr:endo-1,4-beta-xylanase [Baekduia sp.]
MQRVALGLLALAALALAVAAVQGALDGVPDRDAPEVGSLGTRAGVAVQARLLDDKGYAQLVDRVYASVTPENEMKWERLQPERGRWDFTEADRIVDWAREHGKRVRGHALVWHLQNPAWLEDGRFSRDELIGLMRRHIRKVMGRYKGRVQEWDVVNEAVEDDRGALRDSVWLRGIGPEYVALAFRFAREADPGARLYYNDYGAEQEGIKAQGVLRLLRSLKEGGAPVDAVGLQGHVPTTRLPGFAATLQAYRALGLRVAFTEVDVRVAVDGGGEPRRGQRALERQAGRYVTLARGCLAVDCAGFTVWGVDDRHSWVPQAYPGFGAALPFDGDLRSKPAFAALRDALAGR